MSKKKRKKNKKLTIAQLKAKLEKMSSTVETSKKIGFEMLKLTRPKVIDIKDDIQRKERKHKKDYKHIDGE